MVIVVNQELNTIKKKYGEKMAQLCRDLFPTLLENEGVLLKILTAKFHEDKFLYQSIIDNNVEEEFKNYIYSFIDVENNNEIIINKTPKELLEEVGYDLYECHSEEDIQVFKKYYESEEALCTFKGNRLDSCHVFFAVKKNVEEIKRENFSNPQRQDEYGTSVISIQFSKGTINHLSIKNRYNHQVNNSDATFSNNLENIIYGLSNSFEQTYNLNINQNKSSFELPHYVLAEDGKFYRYNYELNNIYYCPNNIIIDNGEVKELDKEKYLLIDYFIINLENEKLNEEGEIIQSKGISLYDEKIDDNFTSYFNGIEKIDIHKQDDEKEIVISFVNEEKATIKINKYNQIIGLDYPKLKTIRNNFLRCNKTLQEISLPESETIGDNFLYFNNTIQKINFPKVKTIGYSFLYYNQILQEIHLAVAEIIGDSFLCSNDTIQKISLPKVKTIGDSFLYYNKTLQEIHLAVAEIIGDSFLQYNNALQEIHFAVAETIGDYFSQYNNTLKEINLLNVETIGKCFLYYNTTLQEIAIPDTANIRFGHSRNIKRENNSWVIIGKSSITDENNINESKKSI